MVVAQRKYDYVEEKIEKNKQSKKNEEKQKNEFKAIHKIQLVFSLVIITSLCIGILLGYVQLTELKYNINSLRKDLHKVEGSIENLRVDVERMQRTDIIEKKAREELGMQYPKKEQMVFLHLDHKALTNEKEEQEASLDKTNKSSLIQNIKGTLSKVFGLLD